MGCRNLDQLRETLRKASRHGKRMIEGPMLSVINDSAAVRHAQESDLHEILEHITIATLNEWVGGAARTRPAASLGCRNNRNDAAPFRGSVP